MVFVAPVLIPEWTFEMYASSEVMKTYFKMMRHPTGDRYERAKYQFTLQLVQELKKWETGKILDVSARHHP